ncbi:MAG: long-chain fatty acid--CoA ligase [Anaerolineales bacterium]|nr:long-chain fatty acid--CoA ligase [Anaerolineales bacterium]MCX7754199.1 long-chain fatty acid--CoA ligase [Anaerolineales bacterium]MDW8276951.1 long-chain fatty acid--CoA ligase [Anaerolineales bacterium]
MENRPWLKNYDEGVPASLDYPPVPLFHFLEESARKYPDRPCTLFKGATISFKEMNEATDRIAGALAAMGVKKGDRVGIFMPNTPQFVMCYFGILKAGGVVVATNPLYTPNEIEHQVNDAGIEVMFVMTNFYKTIKTAQPKTKIKTLIVTNLKETLPPVLRLLFTLFREKKGGFRIEGGLQPGDVWLQDLLKKYTPADRPKLNISPDDTCLFQYSGGTTGISKGAVALHRNIVANSLQIRAWMGKALEEGKDIMLMAIPLFHVYGMVAGMNFALSAGATMVMVPNPRDLKDVLENINKYRPTIFPGVPTLYNALNNHPDVIAGKYDLRSIKACISGSAPLLRETKEKFEALTGGKLFEGYGLSEAPTATHCNPMFGANKTGSIGMPLPDVECKIISLDDGVTELPTGEIGELVIRGPQVMKGYHNMPTETANTLRDLGDGGGPWLFTGDIARMDEDGYFYIVDRKKELIKPGGFQVWPREVEEVIIAHPKVLECGVAGIPDPYRGETVKAWIVKKDDSLTEDEIKAWCKERLAAYKVPTHIEFRTELPKTTVGKILRRELVRQHKEQSGK